MCMSDWSSAVCSSDLERGAAHAFRPAGDDEVGIAAADRPRRPGNSVHAGAAEAIERDTARRVGEAGEQPEIGRAACRGRACQYVADSGGGGSLKNTTTDETRSMRHSMQRPN